MRLCLIGLVLGASLTLGCGTQMESSGGLTSESNTFNPLVTTVGRTGETVQYRLDRDFCYKLVQSQSDLAMTESTSIAKFRKCLIAKGYALES